MSGHLEMELKGVVTFLMWVLVLNLGPLDRQEAPFNITTKQSLFPTLKFKVGSGDQTEVLMRAQ